MGIDRTVPNTGQTVPNAINSINASLKTLEDDRIADAAGLDARLGFVEGGRSQASPFLKVHTNTLYLGGVARSSWPSAASGAFGQVVYGGQAVLNGTTGVTVTHNLNLTPTATSYIVVVQCNDVSKLGLIGEVAYTKSAASVIIKNSGSANISVDIAIVNLNP